MAVRQYIGARYVPVFADPVEWDNVRTYEPLMMVTNQGSTYISRTHVPTGIDISNTDYWVLFSVFSAQVEQYRQEVLAFDGRITENETDIATNTAAIAAETTAREAADTSITTAYTAAIAAETTAREAADTSIDTAYKAADALIENRDKKCVVIGDSWSDSVANTWMQTLIDEYGYQIVANYGHGGSGFIRPSADAAASTFPKQMQEAIADTSFVHDSIGHIIVMGGVNDYREGYVNAANYVNVIKNMLETLKGEFTHAKVHFFIGNLNWLRSTPYSVNTSNTNGQQFYLWLRVKQLLASAGVACNVMYPWLTKPYYQNDDLHPNANGHKVIAANVAAVMEGAALTYMPGRVQCTNGNTTVEIQQQFTSDSVIETMYGIYVTENTATSYLTQVQQGAFENLFVYGENNVGINPFLTRLPQHGAMGVYHESARAAVFANATGTVSADEAGRTYQTCETIELKTYMD